MYRRHEYRPKTKDPTALPLRILCALLGLTAGFAAGRLYGPRDVLEAAASKKRDVRSGEAPQTVTGAAAPLRERIAGLGRTDRDGLAALLAALQQEWEQNGSDPAVAQRTAMQLGALFARWTDLDGPGALKGALSAKNLSFQHLAVPIVFTQWARRDPAAAAHSLTTVPHAALMRGSALGLARAAAHRDSAAAMTLLPAIPGCPAPLLTAAMGTAALQQDASHTLRKMMTAPGVHPALPAGRALGTWLLEDPAAWFVWRRGNAGAAEAAPPMMFEPADMSAARLTHLMSAAREAHGGDEAARVWMLQSSTPSVLRLLAAGVAPAEASLLITELWRSAEKKSPPAATISGWLARLSLSEAAGIAAQRYGSADSAAAMTWATTLPEELAAPAATAIATAMLEDAPATAAAALYSRDTTTPAGRAAAAAAVDRLVRSDPQKALDTLPSLRLDPALTAALQLSAVTQLAHSDPARLLDWQAAHPEPAVPDEALSTALKSITLTDPARAIAHIRSRSSGPARAREAATVTAVWLTRDRSGAMEHLRSLPDGEERDACTAALAAEDLSVRDPFFGANVLPESFEAALHLRDTSSRQSTLRALHQRMTELRVPVQSSLSHPGLRPADRAAILSQ